jgi:uncharacterized protein YjcR
MDTATSNSAESERTLKRIKRHRGGQPGNQNAVTHGVYSEPVRAARRAEAEARYQRHVEYAKTVPAIDYKAICEAIRLGRPAGERSKRRH